MEMLTPMLKQYHEIKSRHSDCILFFRLGDFYEMFAEDARAASPVLDVVLTSRDAGKAGRIPMCGIPYHAADSYIARLIKAGFKVAICEQVEDPALAKGLVKRDVIRVISSGTYIDDASFESRVLVCLCVSGQLWGIAFSDTSSGIIRANEYEGADACVRALSEIQASEYVFPRGEELLVRELLKQSGGGQKIVFSPFEDWAFNADISERALREHFQVHNLGGFGLEGLTLASRAAGGLLEYLKQMHKQPLRHLDRLQLHTDGEYAFVSPAARRGLELDSVREAMDFTLTPMGKRLLKDWVFHPLKSRQQIIARQNVITDLRENERCRSALGTELRNLPDAEKSLTRVSCAIAQARDLAALRTVLIRQPAIGKAVSALGKDHELLCLSDIPELRSLLERALSDDIPCVKAEGSIIRQGYNEELDALRDIQENGRQWLKDLQAREAKRTGINSLKVGFNQVFGYYIEVSAANRDKVPHDFIRRQTLANAERFVTEELKAFEEKTLTAAERVLAIERALVEDIRRQVLDFSPLLHRFFGQLARIDALYSLSLLSLQKGYSAPVIADDTSIEIRAGRHPVVEKNLSGSFIPNDTLLDRGENHCVVLTGPNMAGKSTYIRQNAILVIMAQTGSYIPAASASIGIVDKIFTRIGAHDEIAKGQSTFMVEMSEAAGILNNLSEKSLVVLDEIGRGTSTFDGLSLAWAIADFLAARKVRTLFATHFHELTALSDDYPGVKNYNVSVKEWNGQVVFLHTIVPGGTDDSYGIYVAKLAGVPREVISRAALILDRLEQAGNLRENIRGAAVCNKELSLFRDAGLERLKSEIEGLDLDSMTPLEALKKLNELRDSIQRESHGSGTGINS